VRNRSGQIHIKLSQQFFIQIFFCQGYGAELVVHLFAFVYPFIATVKCISDDNTKKGGEVTSDSTDWLMYWGKQRFLEFLCQFDA
jgi:hypothetical protein